MAELTREKLEEMLDYAVAQFNRTAVKEKPVVDIDAENYNRTPRVAAAGPYRTVQDPHCSSMNQEGTNYQLENAKVALAAATAAATISMALEKLPKAAAPAQKP